jgi:transglutaminase-like putative cysteine protease
VTKATAALDLLGPPAGQLIEETWAAHFIGGNKVGQRQTRVFRLRRDDGPDLLWIVAVDRLQIARFGELTEQELTTASLETEEGQVRQLAYQLKSGDAVQQTRGQVSGSQLELEGSGFGAGRRVTLGWSAQQHGVFAVERSLRRAAMRAGERRIVEAFVPLLDQTAEIELVAERQETVDVDEHDQSLLRIAAVDPRAADQPAETVYWTDATGAIVKTQETFLNRVTVVVDAARAMRPNQAAHVDLGIDVSVPVAQPISQPEAVKYAVYRVRTEGVEPQRVFAIGLSQRVLPAEPDEPDVALVTVSEVTPDQPAVPDIEPDRPQPDDLAPNALVQSDDPRVVAIADSVAGSVDDPWFAAQLLEQHIFRRLSKTTASSIFASAAEVARRRAGDCSEHAVLLAALCRARRIPARVAVGLLYSEADQRFLYHMWTEVWIKDRWIPLDATLGKGGIGGYHLKLRDSSLARQTAYSAILPVYRWAGRIQIEVVAARTSRP